MKNSEKWNLSECIGSGKKVGFSSYNKRCRLMFHSNENNANIRNKLD